MAMRSQCSVGRIDHLSVGIASALHVGPGLARNAAVTASPDFPCDQFHFFCRGSPFFGQTVPKQFVKNLTGICLNSAHGHPLQRQFLSAAVREVPHESVRVNVPTYPFNGSKSVGCGDYTLLPSRGRESIATIALIWIYIISRSQGNRLKLAQ